MTSARICRQRWPPTCELSTLPWSLNPLFTAPPGGRGRPVMVGQFSLTPAALAERIAIYNLPRRFWLMNKRPLGRGLNALLSTPSPPADNEEVLEVQLDLIRPNRQQ